MTRAKQIVLMSALFVVLLPLAALAGEVDLPKTGQTTCYDQSGNVIDCADTGQDGDIQAGVAWPEPRFEDNGDGTITDHLTGLVWLKNANCFGARTWSQGLSDCNTLANGSCGLTDGSVAGDWRLPNIIELEGLVNAEESNSAVWLNTQGFTNVQSSFYWSATTLAYGTDFAWFVAMYNGCVFSGFIKSDSYYVWPVRGGQ